MNPLALLRAFLEAITALARVYPLVKLRQAELEQQRLADELETLADSADLDRVERVRRHWQDARDYHAALQSAISGPAAGSSHPHPGG